MRAVIDTNIWISALLNPDGPPARILAALPRGLFSLLISAPLLNEIDGVLRRPRFERQYGFTSDDADRFVTFLHERGTLVHVTGVIRWCRDPKDDMVIETALNGRADALVSRDDDLKGTPELVAILEQRGVGVLTVRRFLAALDAEPPA
jgi:uncharacterized protein